MLLVATGAPSKSPAARRSGRPVVGRLPPKGRRSAPHAGPVAGRSTQSWSGDTTVVDVPQPQTPHMLLCHPQTDLE